MSEWIKLSDLESDDGTRVVPSTGSNPVAWTNGPFGNGRLSRNPFKVK